MSKHDGYVGDGGIRRTFSSHLLDDMPVTQEENNVIIALEKVRRRASNEDCCERNLTPCGAVNHTNQHSEPDTTKCKPYRGVVEDSNYSKGTNTVINRDHLTTDGNGAMEGKQSEIQKKTSEDEDLYIETFFAAWDNANKSAVKKKESQANSNAAQLNGYTLNSSKAGSSFSTLESYQFASKTRNSFSSRVDGASGRRPSGRRPSTKKAFFEVWNQSNDSSYLTIESFNFGASAQRNSFTTLIDFGGAISKPPSRSTVSKPDHFDFDRNQSGLSSLEESGNGDIKELACFGKTRVPRADHHEGGTRRRISVTSDLTETSYTS